MFAKHKGYIRIRLDDEDHVVRCVYSVMYGLYVSCTRGYCSLVYTYPSYENKMYHIVLIDSTRQRPTDRMQTDYRTQYFYLKHFRSHRATQKKRRD